MKKHDDILITCRGRNDDKFSIHYNGKKITDKAQKDDVLEYLKEALNREVETTQCTNCGNPINSPLAVNFCTQKCQDEHFKKEKMKVRPLMT